MSEADNNEFEALPGLGAILGAAVAHHDQAHMAADERRMQMYRFLDGLSKDQLLALRSILRLSEMGTSWVDGQVVAQLRLQYRVDPDNGEDLLVT